MPIYARFEFFSLSSISLIFFFGQYTLDECGDGPMDAASFLALAINICYVVGAAGLYLYYLVAEKKVSKAKTADDEQKNSFELIPSNVTVQLSRPGPATKRYKLSDIQQQ